MSVTASDIVYYGSANIAEDNSSLQGGAIDTSIRYVFDDSALLINNDTFDVVSDNISDTAQTLTITGRNSEGSIITEDFELNGTTEVVGAITFVSILKIVLDNVCTGSLDITEHSGGQTLLTIEPGVTEVRIPFYNASSDVAGGSSRDFYEKIFIKNNNSTNALLSASISENSDPSSNITFDLEDAVNDNNSIASRLNTVPSGMLDSFTSSEKNVPGTDLGAEDAIGVWLKLTLAAGAAAANSTWTCRVSGSTT